MITIHRGKGGLVIVAGIVAALVMNMVTNAMFDNEYYGAHTWPKFGTFWVAGLLCYLLGLYLRKRPTKVIGEDLVDGEAADHFFFVPVIYWSIIFFVIGVLYAIVKFTSTKP